MLRRIHVLCVSISTRALIFVYSQTHFDTLFSVQSIITSFRIVVERKNVKEKSPDAPTGKIINKLIFSFTLTNNFIYRELVSAAFLLRLEDGERRNFWTVLATISDVREWIFIHRFLGFLFLQSIFLIIFMLRQTFHVKFHFEFVHECF